MGIVANQMSIPFFLYPQGPKKVFGWVFERVSQPMFLTLYPRWPWAWSVKLITSQWPVLYVNGWPPSNESVRSCAKLGSWRPSPLSQNPHRQLSP